MSGLVRAFKKPFITVGYSKADYIVNDSNSVASAIQTIVNDSSTFPDGVRVIVRNGSYNFALNQKISINRSNIIIEAETSRGVTFIATEAVSTGSGQAARFGMLSIGQSNTTKISNIDIKGIIFDCNNKSLTVGLTVAGGTTASIIGCENILIEDVQVTNFGDVIDASPGSGFTLISGTTGDHGNRSYINNLTLRKVELDNSQRHGGYWLGGNVTNLLVEDCDIHDNQADGIQYYCYDDEPTHSFWHIFRSKFYDNVAAGPSAGFGQAHFRDENQIGVNNLTFESVYFGPHLDDTSIISSNYAITPYWAENLKVKDCFFDSPNNCISLGASIAGGYRRLFPVNKAIIKGNIFYNANAVFDPDSTIFCDIADNIFYEIKYQRTIGMYSRHYPTRVARNIIYDCQAEDDGVTFDDYHRAAIQVNGEGNIYEDNWIIDDRKLPNPTNSLTITQTAGGALAARTYYVGYTWENTTGETTISSEQTLAVSANNLFQVTAWSGDYPPTGAKNLKLYIGLVAGSKTLQTTISLPTMSFSWTEPTTGLVAGVAQPVSNTTHTRTKFGIYEIDGSTGYKKNVYRNNVFDGIDTEIRTNGSFESVKYNNYTDRTSIGGTAYLLEPKVSLSGDVMTGDLIVPDEAYTSAWNGSLEVPTKNAVYDKIQTLLGSTAYTPTNVTTDRSFDANATTLDEIADTLGTLIADLQAKGILG